MIVNCFLLNIILYASSLDAFAPSRTLQHHVSTKTIQPRVIRFSPKEDTKCEDAPPPTDTNEVQDIKLPNIFTQHERPQDITSDSFGPLLPIAKAVDDATGGWGLSYADLHPVTPRTRYAK